VKSPIVTFLALSLLQRKQFRLHFFVAWSVRLSSVCHIRAPCLNRLMELDAIWQVHLWGPVTHWVRWGPWPPQGEISGLNIQPERAIANCSQTNSPMLAPGEYKRGERFRLLPKYFGPCFCLICSDYKYTYVRTHSLTYLLIYLKQ